MFPINNYQDIEIHRSIVSNRLSGKYTQKQYYTCWKECFSSTMIQLDILPCNHSHAFKKKKEKVNWHERRLDPRPLNTHNLLSRVWEIFSILSVRETFTSGLDPPSQHRYLGITLQRHKLLPVPITLARQNGSLLISILPVNGNIINLFPIKK